MPTGSPSNTYAGLLLRLLLMSSATLSASCGGRQPAPAGGAAGPTPQASAAAAASPIPWKTIEPPTQVAAPSGSPKARQMAEVKTYSGVGVILSINLKEGWFEIDHEDIKDFMPAMHMQWSVRDRSLLKSIRVGDKVNFTVVDNNGSEVVTELKKAPPAR